MSIFLSPQGVAKVLTSIQQKFLWGGVSHGEKMCKVAWSVVIRSKNRGGLGLGSLQGKNKALLFKWLWWQDFICTTYCPAFENGLPLFNRPLSATWRESTQSLIQTQQFHRPWRAVTQLVMGRQSNSGKTSGWQLALLTFVSHHYMQFQHNLPFV